MESFILMTLLCEGFPEIPLLGVVEFPKVAIKVEMEDFMIMKVR